MGVVLASELPDWIKDLEDPVFEDFVKLCVDVLGPEGALNRDQVLDILDETDFTTALGLLFTMLISNRFEPEEYLIMKDFLGSD